MVEHRTLLLHVAQECSEAVVALTKLLMYGYHATDSTTGISYDNSLERDIEIGDVLAIIDRAIELGAVCPQTVAERRAEKLAFHREHYQ